MLEKHALAGNRIHLGEGYRLAHVKHAIGKRPANDRDPHEAGNLSQRFGDVALRVAVRGVIVKQHAVAAMDLGIEAGPVLDPLQIVVPVERRDDAAALELLFQVGLDRQDHPPHGAFDRQPLRAGRNRDPGLRQHETVADLMGARLARRQGYEILLEVRLQRVERGAEQDNVAPVLVPEGVAVDRGEVEPVFVIGSAERRGPRRQAERVPVEIQNPAAEPNA